MKMTGGLNLKALMKQTVAAPMASGKKVKKGLFGKK